MKRFIYNSIENKFVKLEDEKQLEEIKNKNFSKERLKICQTCDKKTLGICRSCGCIIRFKVIFKSASCPLNKWNSFDD